MAIKGESIKLIRESGMDQSGLDQWNWIKV